MDEAELKRLLKQDLSAGTEEFRDALLARCLAILGSDDGREMDDAELDMLAAAGNIWMMEGARTFGDNKPLES